MPELNTVFLWYQVFSIWFLFNTNFANFLDFSLLQLSIYYSDDSERLLQPQYTDLASAQYSELTVVKSYKETLCFACHVGENSKRIKFNIFHNLLIKLTCIVYLSTGMGNYGVLMRQARSPIIIISSALLRCTVTTECGTTRSTAGTEVCTPVYHVFPCFKLF